MEDVTKTLIENISHSSPWLLVSVYAIYIVSSLIKKYLDGGNIREMGKTCSSYLQNATMCSDDVKQLLMLIKEVLEDCFRDKKSSGNKK